MKNNTANNIAKQYGLEHCIRYDGMHINTNAEYLWEIRHLFESNHYSDIFEQCVDDIINNRKKYYKTYTYTGWSYDNHAYSVNKNGIGHKIYVYIKHINDNKQNISGYIRPRFEYGKNDKVNIVLNIDKDNITLKSFLQHEYTHMIKMYSSDIRNNAFSNRDNTDLIELYYLKDLKQLSYMDENYLYLLNKVISRLYIYSETEQEASINATCMFVKSLSKETIHKYIIKVNEKVQGTHVMYSINNILSKEAQIYNLISNIPTDICFIYRFFEFFEIFESYRNNGYIDICLIIGYYLLIHKWYRSGTKYCSKPFLENVIGKIKDYIKDNPNEKNLINIEIKNIVSRMRKIYRNYKKKIYEVLYQILNDNKNFLTEEIAEKCITNYQMNKQYYDYDVNKEN